MYEIIPPKELETHKIIHRTPTKLEVLRQKHHFTQNHMSNFHHDNRTIAILIKKNESYPREETIMSDSTMEWESNEAIVREAHGDVLIAGLGIGMILVPIIKKPEVRSVTVVEFYEDVISLVHPNISKIDPENKLTIIQGNIFEIDGQLTEKKYNVIYFDIWNGICTDNLEQVKMLKRKFRKFLDKTDPNKYIGAWMEEELRYLARRGR